MKSDECYMIEFVVSYPEADDGERHYAVVYGKKQVAVYINKNIGRLNEDSKYAMRMFLEHGLSYGKVLLTRGCYGYNVARVVQAEHVIGG